MIVAVPCASFLCLVVCLSNCVYRKFILHPLVLTPANPTSIHRDQTVVCIEQSIVMADLATVQSLDNLEIQYNKNINRFSFEGGCRLIWLCSTVPRLSNKSFSCVV